MATDRIMVARDAILEELARRFKQGDKSVSAARDTSRFYHPQKNYFSGNGEMKCPVCSTGTLTYERSPHNGHVRAVCSTQGCVAWME